MESQESNKSSPPSEPPPPATADPAVRAETLRFAVLRHEGAGTVHWDLLVEVAGQERLWTFKIPRPPEEWSGEIMARRLPDHRRVYLSYEGEISGGRGSVVRVEEGTAEVQRAETGRLVVRLEGRRMRLHVTACGEGGGEWRLTFLREER